MEEHPEVTVTNGQVNSSLQGLGCFKTLFSDCRRRLVRIYNIKKKKGKKYARERKETKPRLHT